jgi:hypothetical protein
MTSRVPLVIDYQTQRLTELPENDDIDIANSRILNVQAITCLGEIQSNTVTVNSAVANGNISAAFFIGDGGLLSNIAGGGGGGGSTPPGGITTQVQYNKAGVFGGDSGFVYNDITNTVTVGNISADGFRLSNIAGANVTGWVANANIANISYTSNTSIALRSEVANIYIAGGSAGDVLSTDGAGNVLWMTPTADPTAAGNVGEIQFNTGNLLAASSGLKTDGNTVTITNETSNAGVTEFVYDNISNNSIATFRARGTRTTPLAVQVGDRLMGMSGVAYTANGTATYDDITGWSSATVTSITGTVTSVPSATGRLPGGQLNFNVSNSVNNTSSTMTLAESGKLSVPGIMKVGAFSAVTLRGIVGTVGEMAAVTDASAGGKIAYWDTKNVRWSYVFDNSAV